MAVGERGSPGIERGCVVARRAVVVSSPLANLFSLSRCEETGANMQRERGTADNAA